MDEHRSDSGDIFKVNLQTIAGKVSDILAKDEL
jgi:hypothetical protein